MVLINAFLSKFCTRSLFCGLGWGRVQGKEFTGRGERGERSLNTPVFHWAVNNSWREEKAAPNHCLSPGHRTRGTRGLQGSGSLYKCCNLWQESERGDKFWLGLCEDDPIRNWGFWAILMVFVARP